MPEAHRIAGRIAAGGHELVQRVYFEDTDFSGLVYHARYLHFLERGRSDYLRLLGVHHRDLAADGLAFAVRRMTIDFLRPARIDDLLSVRTRPAEIGGARLSLDQAIFRDEVRLVAARVTIALLTSAGRPQRLPAALRAQLGAAGVPSGGGVTSDS